ncbi:hypothetical protein MRB53_005889 [Persea americana]|uniref:Uncharacterized protein n=1 Tax=Persea americana TaxID=3435 RepID=A0ACC2MED5_PERAE|nr:hypothetical protein MRB53_005889 [Persea americana]
MPSYFSDASASDDCGVFVLAIADHLARRHVLRFTQEDMWYFCQKIVHNIYHRQLDRAPERNVRYLKGVMQQSEYQGSKQWSQAIKRTLDPQ